MPVLLLLAAVAFPAAAVNVDDLYTASVKVADKGPDARAEAFRMALEQVLVKVSGNSAALSDPDLKKQLDAPAQYVQEYRYEPLDEANAAAVGGPVAGAGSSGSGDGTTKTVQATHILKVTFAGPGIDSVLKKHGVVVWGRQRPEVLVWLAIDDGQQRYVVSSDGDTRAHRMLMRDAGARGLPVLLPLMDVTDRSRIEFVDISGGFFDAVRDASARYRSEISLVGHVHRAGGRWQADWTLLGVGDRRAWTASASGLAGAIGSGVHGVADRLAAAFAGHTGAQTALRVRVRAINSLGDYARVGSYLKSLVRVRSARVVEVHPHEAVFEVDLQGLPKDLERTVALGDMLEPVAQAPANAQDDGTGAGSSLGPAVPAGPGDMDNAGDEGGAVATGLGSSAARPEPGNGTATPAATTDTEGATATGIAGGAGSGVAPGDSGQNSGAAPGLDTQAPGQPAELLFRLVG